MIPLSEALFRLGSYTRYYLHARTRYGVHSPFVYRLIEEGLRKPVPRELRDKFRAYRRYWLRHPECLSHAGPGAGSLSLGKGKVRVSQTARVAGSSLRDMALLYRLAAYFRPRRILELGTHLGMGTYALHLGAPQAQILGIEGNGQLHRLASERLARLQVPVDLRLALFDEALPALPAGAPFDLVFVDGNHRYDATMRYFEMLKRLTGPQSLIIWDDIRWTAEMERAWHALIARREVSLSIELRGMGLTFFMPRRQKAHFVLRYG